MAIVSALVVVGAALAGARVRSQMGAARKARRSAPTLLPRVNAASCGCEGCR